MSHYHQRLLKLAFGLIASSCLGLEVSAQEMALQQQVEDGLLAQLPTTAKQLKLRNIQSSVDGFALQINGVPQISTLRVANPNRVILDLQATAVSPEIRDAVIPVNRYGIRQIRVAQFQNSPAIARLVFDLSSDVPINLLSSFDSNRGLFWLRLGGTVLGNPSNVLPAFQTSSTNFVNNKAVIEGLSFNGYGQLVIQSNRAVGYQGSFDSRNNTYTFRIPNSQIAAQLRRPLLGSNSPIEQIRLTQVGDTVAVSIKTISGWQITETGRTNPQEIALQLTSTGQTVMAAKTRSQPLINNNNQNNQIPQIKNRQTNQISQIGNGKQIVVIDPGHGGPDVGATRNGVYEKDIALAMSQQLGQILQRMGYGVVYTRTQDEDVDLEPRVQIAENARASAFVSIHVNSLDANASGVSGVETYHSPNASLGKTLAELVHQQVIASTGANDRGVRSARFHVIFKTSMPAILVETGFITNPSEADRLVSAAYQRQMAEAIANGVDQFLKSYQR
ncbi:N-acetylmuramoyl-L-alanine amidase [Pseudanabaena biceps]|nr:N-acetylmuramoyl-L-alanine amidase [Pseudanabaena biceps]